MILHWLSGVRGRDSRNLLREKFDLLGIQSLSSAAEKILLIRFLRNLSFSFPAWTYTYRIIGYCDYHPVTNIEYCDYFALRIWALDTESSYRPAENIAMWLHFLARSLGSHCIRILLYLHNPCLLLSSVPIACRSQLIPTSPSNQSSSQSQDSAHQFAPSSLSIAPIHLTNERTNGAAAGVRLIRVQLANEIK